MAIIRIGLIGLSQSAKTSWASRGHLPYLQSDRGKQRYQITALLNSSVDAAKRAIEYYELDPETKAYGSAQELAADPDIDLVVCSTRVDVHYDSIMPSVKAGKDVFVEWPLAENKQRATELLDAASKSGSATMVALQARVAPAVLKLKEFLASGEIGKVLSSDVKAATPYGGGYSISEGLGYFLDKKVGGNPVTIAFGHMIDFVHSVLGEFETSHAHLQIQRPNQQIVNRDTQEARSTKSDVPDLVSVHGTLQSSDFVAQGASLTVNFRGGPLFPGTTPFVWTITGEKGEIRVSSERGPFLQSESSATPIPLELHRFDTDDVTRVEWEWEDWQEPLSAQGKDIGKLYDLFYEGKRGGEDGVVNFERAVARHTQLDKMLYPEVST